MEVHGILGPGFLESVYEEALAHEFDLRGIPYERQAKLAVRYKEIVAGEFRADFLVDGKVVIDMGSEGPVGGRARPLRCV
ncbi:MAG TPA: GxxExxY protein [Anaerolineae bacterium]|nr:GxxExxY protein [Anaerolineae bacterium]